MQDFSTVGDCARLSNCVRMGSRPADLRHHRVQPGRGARSRNLWGLQVFNRNIMGSFGKPCHDLRVVGVVIFALLLVGRVAGVLAQASPADPINIAVSTGRHTTYGSIIPFTDGRPEIRTEKLEITLKNTTPESYADLTVRCCIFQKDVQTHKLAVALQHETVISLPAAATLIVTSEVASSTFLPAHNLIVKQRPVRRGDPDVILTTPVKASGNEFAGYGIEVRQNNLAAGEFYGPRHSTNLVLGQLFSAVDLTNQFKTAFSGARKNSR